MGGKFEWIHIHIQSHTICDCIKSMCVQYIVYSSAYIHIQNIQTEFSLVYYTVYFSVRIQTVKPPSQGRWHS